jgi:hypothetical protein
MGVWGVDCSFQSQSSGFIPYCQPNTAMNDLSWMFDTTKFRAGYEVDEKKTPPREKCISDGEGLYTGGF